MIITWFVLLVLGFISYIIQQAPWFYTHVNVISWSIILIASIAFVIQIARKHDGKLYDWSMIAIIFFGYFFRLFLVYWDLNFRHVFLLPSSGFDSERFFSAAARLGHTGTYRYAIVYMSRVFDLFGIQRAVGHYVNILWGLSCVFIGVEIVKKFTNNQFTEDPRPARAVLILGMTLPYFMIMNSLFLREALITFYLVLSLYFFVLWFKDGKLWGIPVSMLFSFLAVLHHSGSVAPIVGYAVIIAYYDTRQKRFRITVPNVLKSVIGLGFVYLVDLFLLNGALFDRFFDMDMEFIVNFVERETGGSAYTFFIHTGQTQIDFIANTPVLMIYLILSPFPWYWRGVFDVISFVFSALLYGYAYYVSIGSLRRQSQDKKGKDAIIMMLIVCVIGVFIFGWGVRNVGTAMRHRDKFLIHHLLLIAFSLRRNFYLKGIGDIR